MAIIGAGLAAATLATGVEVFGPGHDSSLAGGNVGRLAAKKAVKPPVATPETPPATNAPAKPSTHKALGRHVVLDCRPAFPAGSFKAGPEEGKSFPDPLNPTSTIAVLNTYSKNRQVLVMKLGADGTKADRRKVSAVDPSPDVIFRGQDGATPTEMRIRIEPLGDKEVKASADVCFEYSPDRAPSHVEPPFSHDGESGAPPVQPNQPAIPPTQQLAPGIA